MLEERLPDICERIVGEDESIRFAGIANKMGNLVTSTYQHGTIPLMTKEETSQYALRAVVRATTHEDFEVKLGRLQYSVGKYDKLIRATIPIPPSHGDDKSKFYLLLTFDTNSAATTIIERKVMPQIENNKEVFAAEENLTT